MANTEQTNFELTPTRMGDIADQLEDSILKLRSWGIRVIDAGRLRSAVRTLRKYHSVGSFPKNRGQLIAIAQAAREAQEFIEISDVLPDEELKPLADNIQQAVKGTPGTARTQAAQYQSELWVGAMLASSGLSTAVVTAAKGRRPDFVVLIGTMLYPVEVKRPAAELDAPRLIREAGQQIEGPKYHGGVIAVDLSDSLPDDLAIRFGEGPPEENPLREALVRLSGELHAEIFDESAQSIRPGKHHIFCIHTFARTMYWDEADLSQMYLKRLVISVVFYHRAENNLRGYRARALQDALHDGIRAQGHRQDKELRVMAFKKQEAPGA